VAALRSCRCEGCLLECVDRCAVSYYVLRLCQLLGARALPFFSASSAAFAASSTDGAAFELALLGAIAGGLLVARTMGANVGTCIPGQVDSNRGVREMCTRFNLRRQLLY
jgi:hypothetical protein